jgi:tRNA A-37 threonylcarbamoyl transferase component Bud32
MTSQEIHPGILLDGKYEILSLLGAGGMGEIFKARHVHLNTFRCIKVMKQALLADDGFRARFLREAQLATQIHHPNIAVVHDFFVSERGSYMVTEFIDGTTVRQWTSALGRLPLPLAADVACQVLAGLDHIHRRGLLHRDISCDNVMLSYDADDTLLTKIIDLGIAKDTNSVTTDTMAGVFVGNPKYMSPEQLGDLAAGEQVDHRADLYCLGVVLYEMLLGVPPFTSETTHGYIVKHLTQPPRPFAAVAPEIEWPDGLEAIVFRAMEKDRRNRFADAREFSAAMQPLLDAPAGTLTRAAVARLRFGPERVETRVPTGEATQVVDTVTERDWKKTVAEDSVEAYRTYIEDHPDAPDVTEAKARAFELSLLDDVREREAEGDRGAVQRLAEGHPSGSLVGNAAREALARMRTAQKEGQEEEEDFQRAWEAGSSDAWRDFIARHAASPRAARAQEFLLEALAFESAVGSQVQTGIRQFLKTWPDGRHHLEAEIRLVALKRRAAEANEPRDWDAAWEAGTVAAWDQYLGQHGDSPHATEARRCRQEAVDFEQAVATGSVSMWRAFVKAWPDGRHRLDADVRLRAVKLPKE